MGNIGFILTDNNEYFEHDLEEKFFREYFDKFLDESLPEEERIVDYFFCQDYVDNLYPSEDKIYASASAYVFPASENTVWAKEGVKVRTHPLMPHILSDGRKIFLEGYLTEKYYYNIEKIDGEYQVTYWNTVPEGYDDYIERMKSHGIDLENIDFAELTHSKSLKEVYAEKAEKKKISAEKTKEISNIRSGIIVICLFGILTIVFRGTRHKIS